MWPLRYMQSASGAGESLCFPMSQGLLQLHHFFGSSCGETGQVEMNGEFFLASGVVVHMVLDFIGLVMAEVQPLKACNSEIIKPQDLLVPVGIHLCGAVRRDKGVKHVSGIFGGSVFESFLCTLVWCEPCGFVRARNCVLVFVEGLPCQHPFLSFSVGKALQYNMAGGGPSSIDNGFKYSILNAHGLDECLGFSFNSLTTGIRMPTPNDKTIPVNLRDGVGGACREGLGG